MDPSPLNIDLPHLSLGEYPTPVTHLPQLGEVWVKREDASSPVYGGNKLRALEVLMGEAKLLGAGTICTIGAFGSNQAVACALHARRHELRSRLVLFPQRATPTAVENFRVSLAFGDEVHCLRSALLLPYAWARERMRHPGVYFIPPGGATPLGALGHVNAAIELARQVQDGALPAPRHIVLAVGSTCTTAGLLAGFPAAAELGLWPGPLPRIHAVRVTPWPVTARYRILGLARATAKELAKRGGPRVRVDPGMLRVEPRYFGWGYARITEAGLKAAEMFVAQGGPALDTTYSAKSGAALLGLGLKGPVLYWSTKSAAKLPDTKSPTDGWLGSWIRRGEQRYGGRM
jgi:D-cysteine desulfhydrase